MDDKMRLFLLVAVIFYANINLSLASDIVPVLIWGSKNVQYLPHPSAGHSVSNQHFSDNILSKLNEEPAQNLLLFLQDKLSLEDIAQNADAYNQQSDGGVLHNLKNLMLSHTSLHLPRVISPIAAIKSLQDKFVGKVHELRAPYKVDELPLSDTDSNLVVVHLHSEESLKNVDEVIGAVSSRMQSKNLPYNALYTAATSSKAHLETLHLGRHLLQIKEDKFHFYNISPCIFFYAESITFELKNTAEKNATWLLKPGASVVDSTCSSKDPLLVMDFTAEGEGAPIKVQLSIEFSNTSTGYWEAKMWKVTYDVGSQHITDAPLSLQYIYGPYKHSYHCSDPKIEQLKNNSAEKDVTLAVFNIKNLQIQGYKISNDKFGRANDCIGFFSIPIWSGLISVLVLLFILFFGIIMLSSISTMDRFDDPKGKTITVNTVD